MSKMSKMSKITCKVISNQNHPTSDLKS